MGKCIKKSSHGWNYSRVNMTYIFIFNVYKNQLYLYFIISSHYYSYSLKNLSVFLNEANNKFSQPVKEDDYEDLLKTIYYLKEVRDRQYEIDDMFEPIKVYIYIYYFFKYNFKDS